MSSNHNLNNVDSEEHIISEINELNEWNNQYGIHLDDYINRINILLRDHSDIALKELSNLFYDKQFIQQYKAIPTIAYMIVIFTIYKDESTDLTLSKTILDNGNSIDELISHYRKIKFLLWNIEFEVGKSDALAVLNEYITNAHITITELTYIIQSTSINKSEIFLNISQFLRSSNNTIAALTLLTNANTIFSVSEKILCEIADIYFQYGFNEVALKFVNMIENESEGTRCLRNKWGLI